MTRIAHVSHHHHPNAEMADKAHHIVLTISGEPGSYQGRFDRNFIITTRERTEIAIRLQNETRPEARISILDYAATGISKVSKPIEDFSIAPDGQSASFELSMLSNQIVDFGFSILIQTYTPTGILIEYLFCDPQASNDPKLSG